MASTYTDIQKQIAQLEKKAAAFKKLEAAKVIARMKSQIAEYDLTEADLFGSSAAPKGRTKAAAKAATKTVKSAKPPKYMDPKTGKTWNGHGKPPGWIARVKPAKRDDYLIANVEAVLAAKAAPKAKPVAAKKSSSVATKKPAAPAKPTMVANKAPASAERPKAPAAKKTTLAKLNAAEAVATPTAPKQTTPVASEAAPVA